MGEQYYKKPYGQLDPPNRKLVAAGNAPLLTVGRVKLKLSSDATTIDEDVYVVRGLNQLLLGQPAIQKLGLITSIPGVFSIKAVQADTVAERQEKSTKSDSKRCVSSKEIIKRNYPGLFKGLGKLSGQYTIRLRGDVKPFCLLIL